RAPLAGIGVNALLRILLLTRDVSALARATRFRPRSTARPARRSRRSARRRSGWRGGCAGHRERRRAPVQGSGSSGRRRAGSAVLHWGEMGSRWGVNRTVAQIHALLFVSAQPLPDDAIDEALAVAR